MLCMHAFGYNSDESSMLRGVITGGEVVDHLSPVPIDIQYTINLIKTNTFKVN